MSGTDPRSVALAWFESLSAGAHDDAWKLMAPDGVYWILRDRKTMSNSTFAEAYPGMIAQRFTDGLRFVPGSTTAQDDRVSIEVEADGVLRDGTPYESAYVFLFTIVDGLIRNVREYGDTYKAWKTFGGGSE